MRVIKINTLEQLNKEITNIIHCPKLAIDTETTGIEWYRHKIFLIQLCYEDSVWIIDPRGIHWKKLNHFFHVINERIPLLIGHNIKFDLHHIKQSFDVAVLKPKLFDTKIAAHLLNENRKTHLKSLMKTELNIEPEDETRIKQWFKDKKILKKYWDYSLLPDKLIEPYAIMDAFATYQLHIKYVPSINNYFSSLFDTEMKLIKILFKMEQNGVRICPGYLEELKLQYIKIIKSQHDEIMQVIGKNINLNSPKQLSQYLYSDLGLPILKRSLKTQEPSTDIMSLKQLDHAFVSQLIHYRQKQKILSTYIENLLRYNDNGWIHANFNQIGTETGRFSCNAPNLQNQSNHDDIKQVFLPDKDCQMVWWDQSQIEMVIFAHYSRESKMIEIFKTGLDIYQGTAIEVLQKSQITKQERQVFKNMNLAMIYGVGKNKLADFLNLNLDQKLTKEEAITWRKEYLKTFTRIKPFMKEVQNIVHTNRFPWGHYVKNLFGRVRRVDVDMAFTAVNHLIQGCAADIIKRAMVRIEDELHPNWKMQLHDAIRIDLPLDKKDFTEYSNIVQKHLTYCPELSVPIRVKTEVSKTNWAELEKI